MSLTLVRPYFRTRLDSLGYSEWTDGFDFENVPETILDRSYHLEIGSMSLIGTNQTLVDIAYPILVRVYLKGFRDPATAIDDAVEAGEGIICDVTKVTNANGQGIKDVQFASFDVLPKDVASNDNIVLLELSFNARITFDRR